MISVVGLVGWVLVEVGLVEKMTSVVGLVDWVLVVEEGVVDEGVLDEDVVDEVAKAIVDEVASVVDEMM
ncbi:hypothetical protein Pmani_022451 [Petrolisthes manimaculis]|uniref:Uncharacterized protein n=1 Tax=Petrolisthes manimaculis TaxID=1843537 RepID=A0AAE1PC35_9EUCA|nr:hypothetical protein Pmani_022451 [Petrolisthes manimaculis]